MFYLALPNQVLHRTRDRFHRNVGVYAVLVEEIDPIGLKAFEGGFGDFFDVFWPTIKSGLFSLDDVEAELRGYHDLVAKRCESFAYQLFIRERSINLGCVEKCYAAFYRATNQRKALLLVYGWTVTEAQAHTAEANGRDFEIALS